MKPTSGRAILVYLAIREGGQDAFLKAYNREGSFADEPFVKAGEDLKELVDLDPFADGFMAMTYPDSQPKWSTKKPPSNAGPVVIGRVQGRRCRKRCGAGNSAGCPSPVEGGAGNANDVLGGGDGFAVGANAPDETVDFLKFLTSAENQAQAQSVLGVIPTVAAAEDVVTDPLLQQVLKARNEAPYFQLYYDQFLAPAVATAVLDATEGLFAGTLSPEEAAQMIEDAAAWRT